jgi:hypothetical protein
MNNDLPELKLDHHWLLSPEEISVDPPKSHADSVGVMPTELPCWV